MEAVKLEYLLLLFLWINTRCNAGYPKLICLSSLDSQQRQQYAKLTQEYFVISRACITIRKNLFKNEVFLDC